MPLDAIRKSIVAEAEAKASALASEAGDEASRITSEAGERAKAILKQAEEESKREVERMWKENDAGVETERNTMVIEARGQVVEHALRSVRSEALRALEKQGMEGILKKGMKTFAALTGSDEVVVRTSKRNAQLIKLKNAKVEYEDVDGFMLYTPDRKVALNATVESIVDREMDSIRKIVSDEIFTGKEERSIAKAARAVAAKGRGKHKAARRAKPAKRAAKAKKAPRRKRGRR